MERLCKKIAQYIGESIGADDEKISVIEYGMIAIIQFLIILIVSSAIGFIFGFFFETLIVFFSVGFLRRVIGGAHSVSFNSCLLVSIICIDFLSYLSKYIAKNYIGFNYIILFIIFIYIIAVVLIYKLAPVDNPNKVINNPNKIKRLRKQAFIILISYIIITLGLIICCCLYGRNYISYAVSLALSVLWQVTMLTKIGHSLIYLFDKCLGYRCSYF